LDDFTGQRTIGTRRKDTDNVRKLVSAFRDERVREWQRDSGQGILNPL
jgi:hypothetical protein